MLETTDLPKLNTLLNATTLVLLIIGYRQIKRRKDKRGIRVHKRIMLAAAAVSACFLTSYVIYHAQVGSVPYQGQGLLRPIYFTLLVSHIVCAALNVPLVATTLWLGYADRRKAHKKWAKVTFPVWVYVSATGILVYAMLYLG